MGTTRSPEILSCSATSYTLNVLVSFHQIFKNKTYYSSDVLVSSKLKERDTKLWIYENHIGELWGEEFIWKKIIAVTDSTFAAAKKKVWKTFFRRLSSEKEICYTFISLVSSLHRIKNGLWYSFIPLVSSHHSIIGRHGSGFGRYNFGRDDFRVTWPVTCDIISRDKD